MLEYGTRMGSILERGRVEAALIAARSRAEEAARLALHAQAEAERADRAKSNFLANMSHELRTPLNAIIGFSEVMLTTHLAKGSLDKSREYARDINASGHHLLSLINDLLDLAKIEANKLELQEEPIDIEATADSALTVVRQRALERGLDLSTSFPEGLPLLRADERKLRQILINLLSNAIKFTPRGGTVGLAVLPIAAAGVTLRVSDSGIGIALDDIPRVLQPFVQVDSKLGRATEGTGLGLPLADALVRLHGGTLSIQSAVGIGTTIDICFPAERIVDAKR